MSQKQKFAFIGVVVVWFLGLIAYYLSHFNIQVLNPKGVIASGERDCERKPEDQEAQADGREQAGDHRH